MKIKCCPGKILKGYCMEGKIRTPLNYLTWKCKAVKRSCEVQVNFPNSVLRVINHLHNAKHKKEFI